MSPTIYLVSGSNRGIGLGPVTQLAARPDTIVFAGVRDPGKATSLQALAAQHPKTFYVIPLISADEANNANAISQIQSITGRLDVVALEHQRVNYIGPLVLFKAAWPLLEKGEHPKFGIISSLAGSIAVGAGLDSGLLAYGASKAAVNYLAGKIWQEHKNLVVVPINPGGVATDSSLCPEERSTYGVHVAYHYRGERDGYP
ncbi:NADP-binding protein [Dacryopinax primogenitus]|uniref:NADP-binding protein n=1 Tax=Dacryopinax primogenitus (strain DJM 731) TaxID=1858805 RepID=M5GF09_DACPD|nr:NADP-binding protein [Dacryopinax primogenitus]EJU05877.1 NADP-binding protein [Dacryopinax primogenitus]